MNNELRNGATIRVRGAREGGLQNVDIDIPLNTMCCFGGQVGAVTVRLWNAFFMRKAALNT